MTAYEKLMKRTQVFGSTTREQNIFNGKYLVESFLDTDPSYKIGVEILNKGLINLRMTGYQVLQGTSPQMKIQALLSENITFNLGDVFYYDGGYWLCIESNEFHDIYKMGKVEECNYQLRWQNPETLEIVTRWCSIRDPYASGLDETKNITTGNAKYKIKLPYDEETAKFHLDKRFLIDVANGVPIPYKIVKFDSVTNRYAARDEGFLVINLMQDELNTDVDNVELMIADYVIAPPPPDPVGSCAITYSGNPILKSGSTAKPFTAKFWDADDNPIDTIAPIWVLILPPELQNKIVILSELGNEIRLQALSGAVVGSSFLLRMSADDPDLGQFSAEIEIEIGGLI